MSSGVTIAVSTGTIPPYAIERLARRAAVIAAVLFITATASTMAGQILLDGVSNAAVAFTPAQVNLLSLAVVFEIMNGLASAGIALALYPVLRHFSELAATGYLGMRLVEGALGVAAAAGLMVLLVPDSGWAFAYHDAVFLLVLIVFSCGTLLFYPLLFKYRLVPRVLSVWGGIGGLMLLASCVLILFGRIEIGGSVDLVLSLPIWINEMALAVWLLVRGLDLGALREGANHGL
ncbi:MAG: DUF4386 domain-containing protein [Boseongicola sp.]|nr:DUF4386 domain-containing protein [Boseongicola sp.]NNJ69455.1 DUF4386 domain-containing protein [Boseongicola sp.]